MIKLIKNLPGWLHGLIVGSCFGVFLWAISDIVYIGFISKLLGVGVAYLWKIISIKTIWPIFGYLAYNRLDIYGTHRELQQLFLILVCAIIGTLILSGRKVPRIIGFFLVGFILMASFAYLVLALFVAT